jgi:hypothetical protein
MKPVAPKVQVPQEGKALEDGHVRDGASLLQVEVDE